MMKFGRLQLSIVLLSLLGFGQQAGSATFDGLGVFVGTADPNAAAVWNAKYASFKAAMGQDAKTADVFVDWTLPIEGGTNNWSTNAAWQASGISATVLGTSVTPIVSIGLADATTKVNGSWNEANMLAQMNAIAAGTYDATWQSIINAFKNRGYTKIYLRIGQEHNLGSFPWYSTKNATDAAAFVAAFQHVANLAHNLVAGYPITGITVKTVWCPADINWTAVATSTTYPGDAYVDVVGPDCYNHCWPQDLTNWTTTPPMQNGYANSAAWAAVAGNRIHFWDYPNATYWVQQSTGGWGLPAGIAFAKAHNKPFALSECGAGTLTTAQGPLDDGDFPVYLANRLAAAVAQGVRMEYVAVWDINVGDGNWKFSDGSHPLTKAGWQQFVATMAAATGGLPSPKVDADIGSPGAAGSAAYSSGVYTVKGAGAGINGTSDQFNYVHQALAGDQTLIARVTGLSNTSSGAKAGVMMRDSTAANAAFVMEDVSPAGVVEMRFRTSTGGSAGYTSASTGITPSAGTPIWVKLVKSGGNFNGYYATTAGTPAASDWHALGALYHAISSYQGGLAVTSAVGSTLATATIDNVSP
jgi:hypothetical protein